MKAMILDSYGDNVKMTMREVELRELAENEVLIQVKASSVNPLDWKVRDGYLKEMLPLKLPQAIGWDVSGVITKVGNKVTALKVGDEVYSTPMITENSFGTFSEFTIVSEDEVALRPKGLSFSESAALPLVSLTAYQALVNFGKVKRGQKVLIHAGAGGVGHVAIQIAKSLGAYVITTASEPKHEFLKELGADEVIDYRSVKFEDVLSDVDVVLDTMAGDIQEKSLDVLKDNGIIVSLLGFSEDFLERAKKRNIESHHMMIRGNRDDLNAISKLVEEDKLKVKIAKDFPLRDLNEAFELSKSGRVTGKIVINI